MFHGRPQVFYVLFDVILKGETRRQFKQELAINRWLTPSIESADTPGERFSAIRKKDRNPYILS